MTLHTTRSGLTVDVQTAGDAVPGGYNGSYLAYDPTTSALVGGLDYQSARGHPTLIAYVETVEQVQRHGVASLLLAHLKADYDDIEPGYTTDSGGLWWTASRDLEPIPLYTFV